MRPLKGTMPNNFVVKKMRGIPTRFNFSITLPFYLGIKFKRYAKKVIAGPTKVTIYFEIILQK